MSKKKRRKADPAPVVTFRILTVFFDEHRIELDGRSIKVEHPAVTIPIVSGDAVFVPTTGWDRL